MVSEDWGGRGGGAQRDSAGEQGAVGPFCIVMNRNPSNYIS